MDKGTKAFEKTLLDFVTNKANNDPLFKIKFENKKKNIKDGVQYVLNTVQKSGANGFVDDEIYSMIIHYYDEESIDIGKEIDMRVKVNHHVELTAEDKAELKDKAKQEVVNEAKERMKAPKNVRKVTPIQANQSSLF